MKKKVTLIHNPKAGPDQHEKEDLLKAIQKAGYNCEYRSIKDLNWEEIDTDTSIVAVAGGDGAVKQVMQAICSNGALLDQVTLGIIPLGTANNIATSMGIKGTVSKLSKRWGQKTLLYDTGVAVWHNKKEVIVESVGVGLIPAHIQTMIERAEKNKTRKGSIRTAQTNMLRLCASFQSFYAEITVDGEQIAGEMLMVEVLNAKYVGPSVKLGPATFVSDGFFDVVIATEAHRGQLADYLYERIHDRFFDLHLQVLRGKHIEIKAQYGQVHIDDTVHHLPVPAQLSVTVGPEKIRCFVK